MYNRSSSNTANKTPQTLNVHYHENYASGYVVTDRVGVGDAVVYEMLVGVTTDVSTDFLSPPLDGILGLAFNQGEPSTYLNP